MSSFLLTLNVLPSLTQSLLFFISFCFYFVAREYGELLLHCGLIGEAVKFFEDLELWDNLILCYRYDIFQWLLSKLNYSSALTLNLFFIFGIASCGLM